jgi:hypothetical protein
MVVFELRRGSVAARLFFVAGGGFVKGTLAAGMGEIAFEKKAGRIGGNETRISGMSFGAGAVCAGGELGDEPIAVFVWNGWRSGNGGDGEFGEEENEVY